jgi:hypothetical protein
MKSDIEQSYIADIISSRYPTSEPEGIVEVGELTRSPEQFSANATKRDGGVGFAADAAPAESSSSVAQVSQPRFGRAGVTAEQSAAAGGLEKPITALADMLAGIPRGMTAQTMGLGGDLESLYNGLTSIFNRPEDQPRIDAFLQGLAQKTNMATTEQISKEGYRIPFTDINMPPLPPVVPVGSPDQKSREASANYGQFFGELAPIPSILDVGVTGLKAGAKALAPTAANMMEESLRKSGMIMDIVPDGKSVAQQAPKSDIGFYSAVENAAINVQRKSGAGQSFLNDIMKGENVKAEEIKWMGLDDFLKDKKNVTKQEVQDYIANNKVDVQEVKSTVIRPLLDNGARPVFEGDKGAFLPKFGQYVLEGGENYRELLLTMPAKQLTEEEARKILGAAPDAKLSAADISYASRKNVNEFTSSHFPQQENILAHLRVNDRVDADGKKMLLIEEVQSDWHQAGRDSGYLNKDYQKIRQEFADYSNDLADKYNLNPSQNLAMYATIKGIKPEEIAKYEELQKAFIKTEVGVADAPFKDTWYQLALKRALQYASENGYERVGLTTGKQQADRFDLSKQIDTLYPSKELDGTYTIDATKKSDGEVISVAKNIKESELSNYVGKDIANKIIKEKLDLGEDFEMSGVDLKIGGEGMKKYYDEIYPKFLEKYGKKWNAKMGETGITTNRPIVNGVPSMYPDKETVRYIDVTPEMKAGVKKGQPLFAAAPIGAATGAATMQDERKK